MKLIFLILLLFTSIIYSENITYSIKLNFNAILNLYVEDFRPDKFKIDTCKINNFKGICRINNELVFGTDWEMPKYYLKKAHVIINKTKIILDVSSMFNPFFEEPQDKFFVLKKSEGGYILNALLSDGAGGYVAQWKIVNNTAIRTIISDDENIMVNLFYK